MDLQERLKELEYHAFILSMKDHWTAEDFALDHKLAKQIRQIEQQLKEQFGESDN